MRTLEQVTKDLKQIYAEKEALAQREKLVIAEFQELMKNVQAVAQEFGIT